jgi:hypothetical protein
MDFKEQFMYNFASKMCQCVKAIAEIEGMKAENMQREAVGNSMAYTEESFLKVIDENRLGHNDVVADLQANLG